MKRSAWKIDLHKRKKLYKKNFKENTDKKMNFCQENFLTAEKIVNSRINSFNSRKLFEEQKKIVATVYCFNKKLVWKRKQFLDQKIVWNVKYSKKKYFLVESYLETKK